MRQLPHFWPFPLLFFSSPLLWKMMDVSRGTSISALPKCEWVWLTPHGNQGPRMYGTHEYKDENILKHISKKYKKVPNLVCCACRVVKSEIKYAKNYNYQHKYVAALVPEFFVCFDATNFRLTRSIFSPPPPPPNSLNALKIIRPFWGRERGRTEGN